MNRIWISRRSSIPIREQLSTQLQFGILSKRLKPAERLPSVRDLARRIKVHPNTVSAAYQDLAERGWVARKAGSGVFVCNNKQNSGEEGIDEFVRTWMEEGHRRGFSPEAIRTALEHASEKREPRKLLVVHPDYHLARILAAEIADAIGCNVPGIGLDEAAQAAELETHLLLTTTPGAATISRLRPEGYRLIPLKSVEEFLTGLRPPVSPLLIGVVSRSETILKWASLLIPALGLPDSDMVQRNPERRDWQQGLGACDMVVADVLTVLELPKNVSPVVLRLIPDSFLQEMKGLVTAQKV